MTNCSEIDFDACLRYLTLFAITLVILVLWPVYEVLVSRKLSELWGLIGNLYHSLRSSIKEKNEDEQCEYEEMWDAEGTMHLIKKGKKVSPAVLNEGTSIDR